VGLFLETHTSGQDALAPPGEAYLQTRWLPRWVIQSRWHLRPHHGRIRRVLAGTSPAAKADWRPVLQFWRYSHPPAPQKRSQAAGRVGGRDKSRAAHLQPGGAGTKRGGWVGMFARVPHLRPRCMGTIRKDLIENALPAIVHGPGCSLACGELGGRQSCPLVGAFVIATVL
jgi:hypothetical protein